MITENSGNRKLRGDTIIYMKRNNKYTLSCPTWRSSRIGDYIVHLCGIIEFPPTPLVTSPLIFSRGPRVACQSDALPAEVSMNEYLGTYDAEGVAYFAERAGFMAYVAEETHQADLADAGPMDEDNIETVPGVPVFSAPQEVGRGSDTQFLQRHGLLEERRSNAPYLAGLSLPQPGAQGLTAAPDVPRTPTKPDNSFEVKRGSERKQSGPKPHIVKVMTPAGCVLDPSNCIPPGSQIMGNSAAQSSGGVLEGGVGAFKKPRSLP